MLGVRFLGGDDFNAKYQHWGSRLTASKGYELYRSMDNLQLETFSTDEPTYWPTNRRIIPHVTDFHIIKGIQKRVNESKIQCDLFFNHSPNIITHYSKIIKNKQPCSLSNTRKDSNYYSQQLKK